MTGILAEHRRISRDMGSERVASLTENLHNDQETGFQDDGQHLLLGVAGDGAPAVPQPGGPEVTAGGGVDLVDLEFTPENDTTRPSLQQELAQADSQERRRRRMDGAPSSQNAPSLMKSVMDSLRQGVGVLRGRPSKRNVLPPVYPGGPLDRSRRARSEPSVSGRQSTDNSPQVTPDSSPTEQVAPVIGGVGTPGVVLVEATPTPRPCHTVGAPSQDRLGGMQEASSPTLRTELTVGASPALNPARRERTVNLFAPPSRPGSRSARLVRPRRCTWI